MATKLKGLSLAELSFVDRPANKGSRVTIYKRDASMTTERLALLAKSLYYGAMPSSGGGDADDDGARSFNEILAEREQQRQECKISDALWPLFSALNDAVISVVNDAAITGDDAKMMAIRLSVEQFMAAASKTLPQAEAELEKLLKLNPASAEVLKAGEAGDTTHPGGHMADTTKEVEALKTQVADLTKKLETSDKAGGEAKKAAEDAKKASEAKDAKIAELEAAAKEKPKDGETDEKKAADKKKFDEAVKAAADAEVEKRLTVIKSDEVITIKDGDATKEIRKSVVGDQVFAMFKSQNAEIAKANEDRELVTLEKRAAMEFGNLPGAVIAKAKVLKAIAGIPDDQVRKDLEAMLKGGNAGLKKGMTVIGQDGEGNTDDPSVKLDNMASELAKKDNITKAAAYDRVLSTDEGKTLYRESIGQPKSAAA